MRRRGRSATALGRLCIPALNQLRVENNQKKKSVCTEHGQTLYCPHTPNSVAWSTLHSICPELGTTSNPETTKARRGCAQVLCIDHAILHKDLSILVSGCPQRPGVHSEDCMGSPEGHSPKCPLPDPPHRGGPDNLASSRAASHLQGRYRSSPVLLEVFHA